MRILIPGEGALAILGIFRGVATFLKQNAFIFAFVVVHILFAILLGRLFAFAPDEGGYLYAFNNIYTLPINTTAQSGSGWITAPTLFLWVAYLPAKVLNIIGIPDYLAIRFLSIFMATITLCLLSKILEQRTVVRVVAHRYILAVFFIPSVFLWTSVGLRETFIIVETALFLAGLNLLVKGHNKRSYLYLFLGSYGLVSTKNYLWACLMVTVILSSVVFLFRGLNRRKIIKFLVTSFLLPVIAFAGTTSPYALDYIFHGNITATGARSGDSITKVYVDSTGTGTGTGAGAGKELITFHGDYTLVALRFYLIDNPNALFTNVFKLTRLDKKIESIWDEKITLGLVSKDKQVGTDTSSLNGHILEPAKISKPLSLIWPAFLFLCGPFPFVNDPGIAVFFASLESPLWWALYALVVIQFIRFRKMKFL